MEIIKMMLLQRVLLTLMILSACKDKDKDKDGATKNRGVVTPEAGPIDAPPAPTACNPANPAHSSKANAGPDTGHPVGCPPPCNGNSPTVNAFPINGLDVDGQGSCSPEEVQVVPMSLEGGKGCKPGKYNLTVDATRTKLVAKNNDSSCEGEDLENSTFDVRSGSTTAHFKISKARAIKVAKSTYVPMGYRIVEVVKGNPTDIKDVSLCDLGASNNVRKELNLPLLQSYEVAGITKPLDDNSDFVIVVHDPLYTPFVQPIDVAKDKFFNLACVDDALAKRTFDYLYTPADDAYNLAALKMMTATYCGAPYTTRGMQFHWKENLVHSSPKNAEARWLPGNVSCLETPRLVTLEQQGKHTSDLPDELVPYSCKPAGRGIKCKTWDQWADAVRDECPGEGSGSGSAVPLAGNFKSCESPNLLWDYESWPGRKDADGTVSNNFERNPPSIHSGSGSGSGQPKPAN